jgi:hypothetical protein
MAGTCRNAGAALTEDQIEQIWRLMPQAVALIKQMQMIASGPASTPTPTDVATASTTKANETMPATTSKKRKHKSSEKKAFECSDAQASSVVGNNPDIIDLTKDESEWKW